MTKPQLTREERVVLEALDQPQTVRHLAGRVSIDYDVVHGLLRRLQDRGLVERRATPPSNLRVEWARSDEDRDA